MKEQTVVVGRDYELPFHQNLGYMKILYGPSYITDRQAHVVLEERICNHNFKANKNLHCISCDEGEH